MSNKMIKIRLHRGGFPASMATMKECANNQECLEYLRHNGINIETVKARWYNDYDERNGWEMVYIVTGQFEDAKSDQLRYPVAFSDEVIYSAEEFEILKDKLPPERLTACKACPFAFTDESENIQNLGCLPTPGELLQLKKDKNLNWTCHENHKQKCQGMQEYCKDLDFSIGNDISSATALKQGLDVAVSEANFTTKE